MKSYRIFELGDADIRQAIIEFVQNHEGVTAEIISLSEVVDYGIEEETRTGKMSCKLTADWGPSRPREYGVVE